MDASTKDQFIKDLLLKLKDNELLKRTEREFLLDMFQSCSENETTLRSNKRVRYSTEKPQQGIHKKVQVSVRNTKDSCTQTESVANDSLNTTAALEDLLEKMKVISTSRQIDETEVSSLMDKTYEDRRIFIMLKNPEVLYVKEVYPLLFSANEIKNELDRIFYAGKSSEFLSKIEQYAPIILESAPKDHVIYQMLLGHAETSKRISQKKYAQQTAALLLLPQIFEEELDFLTLSYDSRGPGYFPHIISPTAEFAEMFNDIYMYKIVVEGTTLCEADSFPEAILMLVASCFIFNIAYQRSCLRTFVTFEKLFLTADDTPLDSYTAKILKNLKTKLNQSSNLNADKPANNVE